MSETADGDHSGPANVAGVEAFGATHEPFRRFAEWFDEAAASEPNDPNAMALATVDATGMPNVRMVLLKGFDGDGFVFYTNLESQKGREIAHCAKAALCFHWKSLRRQVRVRGALQGVSEQEADEYYHSRPLGSRLGAWASKQSRPLESAHALEAAVAAYTARYALATPPRPRHWSGFRLAPIEIEFWRDRPFRLHERIVFRRSRPDTRWHEERLYP
ncbi:MAG: pyridoxamine 5'-phosphate oxidase [Rhizobiales bacterium]|nr:pyridoxamine 5'-phosphate oxidase [Hyphomicrobiales bacterium]